MRRLRSVACILLLYPVGSTQLRAAESDSAPAADGYWATRDRLDQAYAAQLAGLASKCEELQLAAQAQATRRWAGARDPHRQYIFLPAEADRLQPPAEAETVRHQWYKRFRELRQAQAQALFLLAQDELAAGHAARAYQLVHEVLHENPDHEQARQVLGYRQADGRWRRPEGSIRSRALRAPQDLLGFQAGQSWTAESEHFTLMTNESQAAAEQLAASLEDLYGVWQQVFFAYWSNAAALKRRFDNPAPSAARGGLRHKVVLFRNRQEYVDRLRKLEPQIEVSVGFYSEPTKTAYFYSGAPNAAEKSFHEVTHQLFAETGRVTTPAGRNGNFWILEGAAMYLESLQRCEQCWTVGGLDAHRLFFARYRALNEKFYLPLAEFSSFGRQAWQQHPDLANLYSQAAGLTAFLMDHRRGWYREATVSYLQAVYQGRDRPETLASLTGVELSQLDADYLQSLRQITDADLAYLAALPSARSLCLAHTAVTDAGLVHLAGHRELERLDLNSTKIGDAGFAQLQHAARLTQLTLGYTQITDAAGITLGKLRELEFLDLTGTRLTDAGLIPIAELTGLKDLALGGTRISDAGLAHLRKLQRLETLDVRQTQVTPAGVKELQAVLPALKTE